MTPYVSLRNPPEKRRAYCTGGKEKHLTEAAVMIAFALHLLDKGASEVEIHPDGEHGKRYDIRGCLKSRGFMLREARGTTAYGGVYHDNNQELTVFPKPGLGDVRAKLSGNTVVAECKGGVINTSHSGQLSKLRKGLCEAVGLLMARSQNGERHIAVVPASEETTKLAVRMRNRASAAGIEIALVNESGDIEFVRNRFAAKA